MYYLRTKAAAQAVQFTVEKQGGKAKEPLNDASDVRTGTTDAIDESLLTGGSCSMEEGCVTCSS